MICLVALFCGCSYSTEKIKTLMADPDYTRHQEELGNLEKSYLDKKMTYSEYLEKKKQLEDHYTKEMQAREEKIHQ